MKFLRLSWISTSLFIVSITLSGCTPEKAKAVRIGAVQFKNESFACLDAIDAMRHKELEPPPRSQIEVQQEFINNILTSDSPIIKPEEIELARNPNAVEIEATTEQAWQNFLGQMKGQYSNFAAIYDRVEAGSFLATDAVRRSGKYAEKLTVQMAAFAKVTLENPPQLIQYQTDISARLTQLKRQYQQLKASGTPDTSLQPIREQVAELLAEWEDVKQQEQTLLVATVTPCLRAAILGKNLRQLIDRYGDLDLDTLNSIIARILDRAAVVTGQNLNSLKLTATTVFEEIRAEESLRSLADEALKQVSQPTP
jgi:hypothetical protein